MVWIGLASSVFCDGVAIAALFNDFPWVELLAANVGGWAGAFTLITILDL